MKNIFIAHAKSDARVASEIAHKLRSRGHGAFFDEDSLSPAQDYDAKIRAEISSAHVFVFLLSPESIKPRCYALTELKIARERWPSPAGRVLAVVVQALDLAAAPTYLTAVGTVLRPEGNVAVEAADEAARLADRVGALDAIPDHSPGGLWPTLRWKAAFHFGLPHQDDRRRLLGAYLDRFIEEMRRQNGSVLAPAQYVPPRGRQANTGRIPRYRPMDIPDRHVKARVRELIALQGGGTRATADLAAAEHPSRLVRDVVERLLRTSLPVVLLAEPGFGKSMTLRQVGLTIAERNRSRADPLVPIYLRLGEYRPQRADPNSVTTFVRERFADHAGDLRDDFDRLFERGRLVLIFDGMDEMDRAGAVGYDQRVAALSKFAGRNSACKMLFACRSNDFLPTFAHHQMVLVPFEAAQMRELVRRNLFVDGEGRARSVSIDGQPHDRADAARVVEKLRATPMGHSMGSPLILALSCRYIEAEGHLPVARDALFHWFVRELAEHMVKTRTARNATTPPETAVIAAWADLAFVVTRHAAGTVISSAELNRHFGDAGKTAVEWGVEAGLLLSYNNPTCAENARHQRQLDPTIEPGPTKSYAFVHHRLQEYLAAYHLARCNALAPDFWEQALDVPRWQEVVLHLASLGGEHDPAFQVLRNSLEFPDKLPADVEARRADRVMLAARVAMTNERCVSPDLVEPALASMAKRGRPPAKMKALQATVHFERAARRVAATLRRDPVGWIRRKALVVEAHAERHERRDPRWDMAQSLLDGDWPVSMTDYLHLVRQKGTRRWTWAFAATWIIWLIGQVVALGTPTALLFSVKWIAPQSWTKLKILPSVGIWGAAAVLMALVAISAVLARSIRTRSSDDDKWHQVALATLPFVILLVIETSMTGPIAALLMAIGAIPSCFIIATLATTIASLIRAMLFVLLTIPYGASSRDLLGIAKRAGEPLSGVFEKDLISTLTPLLMLFWIGYAGGFGAEHFGATTFGTMAMIVSMSSWIAIGAILALRWIVLFLASVPRWPRVLLDLVRRPKRSVRAGRAFGKVIMAAVGVAVVLVAVSGLVGGGGVACSKLAEVEKQSPNARQYGSWILWVLIVVLVAVTVWLLLRPAIRSRLRRVRERRALRDPSIHHRSEEWQQEWLHRFQRLEAPDIQLLMLGQLKAVQEHGELSIGKRLSLLYAIEAHIREDPAASEYWQEVAELEAIDRQARLLE